MMWLVVRITFSTVHTTLSYSVSVLFSDIVTFTVIASKCEPNQIVMLLNEMYIRFDAATENNRVYKVRYCV